MEKLIEVKGVSAGYEHKVVLHDVDLAVWKGDFLGIIGPNGGGKTTLMRVLLKLIHPVKGEIHYYRDGAEVGDLRVGYLPQMSNIDRKFPINVRQVIASGLAADRKLFHPFSASQEQRVTEVLDIVGMKEFANRSIAELSGGQFQRVLLGRSIVSRPELLVLDEPGAYVDKRFESHFYPILSEINKESTVILVSHDLGTVLSVVKNIACVNENLHYHSGTDITTEWLGEKYSCPFELVGHGSLPHRVLLKHDD